MASNTNEQVLEEIIMKRLKSKTYIFNILIGLCGVIQLNSEVLTDLLGKKYVGLLMMGFAAIGFVLRELTKAPVNEK